MLGVRALGNRDSSLGFRFKGLEFGCLGLGLRVRAMGKGGWFRASCLELKI